MTTTETSTGATAPSAHLTSDLDPRQHAGGVALALMGAVSNQTGAAVGATAFPAIGPVGVVAVRQLVVAAVLVPAVRPSLRGLRRDQWLPVLGLAVVFGVMNLGLYGAIERIGLGLAVTLEFVGPLAVAVVDARRSGGLLAAALAGVGVVVLTDPGPTSDLLGIAMALTAAAAWAAYIVLNRTVGRQMPGLTGTALASLMSAGLWLPVGLVWFVVHPPTIEAVLLAAACGVLASLVPYVVDLLALRRVSAGSFAALTSANPVVAAVAGLVLLDERLGLQAWVGIALVVTGNLLVTMRGLGGPPSLRSARAGTGRSAAR
ncbi:EamA family transporter [Janibacter melonis]|uniref:EamA family transporter n=1 Tax=Janibacter melonis TaxID=262209 RepID=UPI00177D2EF2|nr:EamA family transporter [Janibacter melonis]